jgi:diguanylate cyclase (GGDEF)-like protein
MRQGRVAHHAAAAANATDRYEQARYLGAIQHAEHEEALGDPSNEHARAAHRAAAASFVDVLEVLRETDSDDTASLNDILVDQGRYLSLTDRFFAMTASGRDQDAAELHDEEIEAVEQRILSGVNGLAAKNRAAGQAAQADLQRNTVAMQVGTPMILTIGLALFILFALITRSYRRTAEVGAAYDALTGLPNRTLYQQRCDETLRDAGRTGAEPVVLLLDLNNFKEVNDALGHHLGDQLLARVAGRLAQTLRDGDTVARLGGDEFAILLADGGPAAGERVAENVSTALGKPFVLDDITIDIEASIGIAAAGPDDDVVTVVRHADTAMYMAKRYHLGHAHYAPTQGNKTIAQFSLLSDLRRALDDDQFVLHYQPKVAMDTGEVIGVEALTRWQHPTRGLVFPDEFIAAVESTNLRQRFALHVVKEALAHTRSWLDRGRRLPVAVNISTRCLLDPRFPEAIAAQLHAAAVPPDLLCLEITEDTIMADPDLAVDVLRRIRGLGVRTSIDDFGTGYSSMAYLKLLPVDELKIDRSFVQDMATDTRNAMLVQSAIELGHSLGLHVVAEGIEDDATRTALQELGCDVAQGYLYSRPLPADALATWILTRCGVPDDHPQNVTGSSGEGELARGTTLTH